MRSPACLINVPFLVSKMVIERPLLGFNVVEELIHGQPEPFIPTFTTLLSRAIGVPSEKAQTLIEVIQTAEEEEEDRLKVGRIGVVISARQVAWVQYQVPPKLAQRDSVVLFEP